MPIIKKSKKIQKKAGVILRRRAITSNHLQELILITCFLWNKKKWPINPKTLINGLKERGRWDAFNHIYILFDIFILNIDRKIDRQKVHLNLGSEAGNEVEVRFVVPQFSLKSLINGLKEWSCRDAFNHIIFDIFVMIFGDAKMFFPTSKKSHVLSRVW